MRRGSGPGVAAGQHQQVVDEVLHADGLLEDPLPGGGGVGPVRVGGVHLDLGAEPGERAAQLVGRVGHEPLLAPGAVLDPVEHGVHRAGEAGHLVAGGGHGHPPVEPAGADARDLPADGLDRAQRPADEHPHQGGQQQGGGGDGHGQRPGQQPGALGHVVERRGHEDRRGSGRARHDPVGRRSLVVDRQVDRAGAAAVVARRGDRHERRPVGVTGGGRHHAAVRLHDLGHGVVVPHGIEGRRQVAGLGAGGQVARPLGQRVVEVLGEDAPLVEHEGTAGHDEHPGHRQRRHHGDAEADGRRQAGVTGHR